jgi:pimeloyl-ACP methyl ester carboxylesterase
MSTPPTTSNQTNAILGFVEPARVEQYRLALEGDAEFVLASRRMSAVLLLRVGAHRCYIEIREGRVPSMTVVSPGDYVLRGEDISISATEHVWSEMLKAKPAPGYFDILPACAWYGLELGGDLIIHDAFRHAISRMVWVFREVHSGSRREFTPRSLPAPGTIEPILGRYVHLTVGSIQYRVYFEEGGNPDGIPLICQHTAGTHCSQWRGLMNDPEVASRFRIIAHDLPFHGKSLPPEGTDWWAREYKLDEVLALEFPVALAEALGLDRPVYIGASIGGMIAIDLPWKHPGYFRAVISCEAGEYMPGWSAQIPSLSDPLSRNATAEMGYCQSPTIPVQNMHECTFMNDSCAFGIVGGDVHYYAYVHDLRDKYPMFDTTKTMVYIMNGEYDLATPPALGDLIASKIPGAKSIHLMGLGHFPHCEDYDLFKTYLHPVLAEIAAIAT